MSETKEILLKEYQRPFFWIKNIDLEIDIFEDKTFVVSELTVERNSEFNDRHDLVLDGINLKLLNIELNNVPMHDDHYQVEKEKLIIKTHEDKFTLTTKVEIHPETNLSGEGLYKSGSIFCSQNEAEGFRNITYYLDRPDVMAKFKTTLKADKKLFPYLLSNGNKVDSGDLDNARHFAVWEDPHFKPCYLYAAVAGDLALVKDTFTTMSGRKVELEIYVDHGNEDKCEHAMRSLINSMKWDEEKFGLEYDLDIYMIVAVDSFNMGAMENKGLNIFNSAYVLAKQETATDHDFQGIEAVIGHEYFHNWTGNRVTCRDWFQLTLKEGLTVFRDQEFSSDMLSRSVKRIEDVMGLRNHQFAEDAGPMSHPIKPKSYIEINNFYSATVYEKGAEVIRMIHTIIGAENFRKGMDLYFKRHDGQAVTTEDFVSAMSDASGEDLEQFKVWYDQNGTPVLDITTNFDEAKKEFNFTIKQSTKLNNNEFSALHIPFKYGLINSEGVEFASGMLHLKQAEETFTVHNVDSNPIPSWNREFTAPVKINYEYSNEELIYLMAHDSDDFNRYNSAAKLYEKQIHELVTSFQKGIEVAIDGHLLEAYGKLLIDKNVDPAFKSLTLKMPTENYINEQLEVHDYDNVAKAINLLKTTLATFYKDTVVKLYNGIEFDEKFSVDAKTMGKRALKNTLLELIANSNHDTKGNILISHYDQAKNMTDEISGLKNIVHSLPSVKDAAIKKFYDKWNSETLVMQKWLGVQASRPGITAEEVLELEKSDAFDIKIPNCIRALYRSFIALNPVAFNAQDGSGYKLIADKIIEVDKFNPQIASGLSKSLRHLKNLDVNRSEKLKEQLERLLNEKLSNDTFEVISRNLKN